MIPSFIYLYNSSNTENLDLEKIRQYLKIFFKTSKVEIRNDFISHYFPNLSSEKLEFFAKNS